MSRMKSGLLAFACLFALSAGTAQAGWDQSFEIGPDVYYYHYTEPGFAHYLGFFYGADAAYTVSYNKLGLRLEGRAAAASLKYDGSGTSNGNDHYTAETRALLEREFAIDDNWSITPYAGIGFRDLFDASGGVVTSTGALGYDRESHYYYLPIGLQVPVTLAPDWRIVPSVEYDYLIQGYQHTYLTNIPGFSNDLTNSQSEGHGFRASLMVEGKTPIGSVKFGPYLRYWSIGVSNVQSTSYFGTPLIGYEPGNHTVEAGASLVYIFQ